MFKTWEKFTEPENIEHITNKLVELIGANTSPDQLYEFLGKLLCPPGTKTSTQKGGAYESDVGGEGGGSKDDGKIEDMKIECNDVDPVTIKRILVL